MLKLRERIMKKRCDFSPYLSSGAPCWLVRPCLSVPTPPLPASARRCPDSAQHASPLTSLLLLCGCWPRSKQEGAQEAGRERKAFCFAVSAGVKPMTVFHPSSGRWGWQLIGSSSQLFAHSQNQPPGVPLRGATSWALSCCLPKQNAKSWMA